jgi:single-strand DNA-binding protein
MVNMNEVKFTGRLTKDPVLRETKSGKPACNLSVANNRKYSVNGADRVETTFMDVETYGANAAAVAKCLKKGSPVLVNGSLKFQAWESNGQKHSKVVILAQRVQFLEKAQGAAQPAVQAAQPLAMAA